MAASRVPTVSRLMVRFGRSQLGSTATTAVVECAGDRAGDGDWGERAAGWRS